MNFLVRQFFSEEEGKGEIHFREVRFLNQEKDWDWETVSKRAPNLPRPWFELSRISAEDRIEFVRDLWVDELPYSPSTYERLVNFFERLDDIDIVLHRQGEEDCLTAEMVYSLEDGSSFFRGLIPCSMQEMDTLRSSVAVELPRDFQAFYRIHNGFGKLSELGLLKADEIAEERQNLINTLLASNRFVESQGQLLDPGSLIPFYEAFGLASYQCFFTDWYPSSEMGNIYLSGIDYTISDITNRATWTEQMAFVSFTEWLLYYLEGMTSLT